MVEDSAQDVTQRVQMRGFLALSGVGFLDSGTRSAALTFLPFIMKDKGMSDEQTFTLLLFLLAGGAAGKIVCGWLNDRFGSIRLIWGTKGLTAILLLAALATPPLAMAPLMVVLGIGLNGTSSVLYATVSNFVPARKRARVYGYYYTVTETGGTLAPAIYGRIADLLNIRIAIGVMSLVTSLILPASLALRKPLATQETPAADSSPTAD
jgi:MFS family permease